ncbi:hypothetical protein DIPPA_27141 [Diplonema papillatum]|nr:hypothetical protein DIPPA_27141 [Diplonema papillatum]KAJ9451229.1 hypothetical protein DIPPA_27141 [Diplonema papillatum]
MAERRQRWRDLLQQGEIESAAAEIRESAETGDADAIMMMGVILEGCGLFEPAEEHFARAARCGSVIGMAELCGRLLKRGAAPAGSCVLSDEAARLHVQDDGATMEGSLWADKVVAVLEPVRRARDEDTAYLSALGYQGAVFLDCPTIHSDELLAFSEASDVYSRLAEHLDEKLGFPATPPDSLPGLRSMLRVAHLRRSRAARQAVVQLHARAEKAMMPLTDEEERTVGRFLEIAESAERDASRVPADPTPEAPPQTLPTTIDNDASHAEPETGDPTPEVPPQTLPTTIDTDTSHSEPETGDPTPEVPPQIMPTTNGSDPSHTEPELVQQAADDTAPDVCGQPAEATDTRDPGAPQEPCSPREDTLPGVSAEPAEDEKKAADPAGDPAGVDSRPEREEGPQTHAAADASTLCSAEAAAKPAVPEDERHAADNGAFKSQLSAAHQEAGDPVDEQPALASGVLPSRTPSTAAEVEESAAIKSPPPAIAVPPAHPHETPGPPVRRAEDEGDCRGAPQNGPPAAKPEQPPPRAEAVDAQRLAGKRAALAQRRRYRELLDSGDMQRAAAAIKAAADEGSGDALMMMGTILKGCNLHEPALGYFCRAEEAGCSLATFERATSLLATCTVPAHAPLGLDDDAAVDASTPEKRAAAAAARQLLRKFIGQMEADGALRVEDEDSAYKLALVAIGCVEAALGELAAAYDCWASAVAALKEDALLNSKYLRHALFRQARAAEDLLRENKAAGGNLGECDVLRLYDEAASLGHRAALKIAGVLHTKREREEASKRKAHDSNQGQVQVQGQGQVQGQVQGQGGLRHNPAAATNGPRTAPRALPPPVAELPHAAAADILRQLAKQSAAVEKLTELVDQQRSEIQRLSERVRTLESSPAKHWEPPAGSDTHSAHSGSGLRGSAGGDDDVAVGVFDRRLLSSKVLLSADGGTIMHRRGSPAATSTATVTLHVNNCVEWDTTLDVKEGGAGWSLCMGVLPKSAAATPLADGHPRLKPGDTKDSWGVDHNKRLQTLVYRQKTHPTTFVSGWIKNGVTIRSRWDGPTGMLRFARLHPREMGAAVDFGFHSLCLERGEHFVPAVWVDSKYADVSVTFKLA